MDLKPSFSCSLFIKSVWALLGFTGQARVLVDRSWFQGFGFCLFFKYVRSNSSFVQFVYCDSLLSKIVECVGFTLIYYDQGDSLLSKNVFCDADFNEYVSYSFNLIYYAQGEPVRVTRDAGVVVEVAHEVHPDDPQISAVQQDLQIQSL